MSAPVRAGGSAASASSSATIVISEEPAASAQEEQVQPLTLTLEPRTRPRVRWNADVVDNEDMGKKSSKRCCIFHKPKQFGESDSEESDSDVSDGERERRWEEGAPGKPGRGQVYHA
jgi:protein phosphatase 1 regulatory subunit 11